MIADISTDVIFAVVLGFGLTITILVLTLRDKKKDGSIQRSILSDDLWIESPLIKSEWLSRFLGSGDSKYRVNIKLDAVQPSGSFKIRGISTYMKKQYGLSSSIDTFISTSSANAGMAVAYTAQKLNCKCLIILDETQRDSNELLQELETTYNAEIKYHGSTWNEADEYAIKLGSDSSGKYHYVPMFDHPAIFDGHSSIIRELSEQYKLGFGGLDDNYPDCIICSVGGGGLLNGILGGLFQVGWSRNTKIVAAQSINSALFQNGINNGYKPKAIKTISADGIDLGFRAISEKTMNLTEKYEKFNPIKSIVVNDNDVLNICTLFGIKHHILIEPLCAVAIAALYKNKEYFKQFNNITIIVCGGNHIYFNKELLNNSIKNGSFNDEKTIFSPKESSINNNKYRIHEEKEQDIDDDQDIDAYDSETEEM